MKVKDIMSTRVVTVLPDDTVLSAAKAMRDEHVGDVVMVEKSSTGAYPRGILTDRDLVVGVLAQDIRDIGSLLVKDVIGQELHVTDADKDLLEVIARMRHFGVRRLPVVNRLDVLVGIITLDDAIAALADTLTHLARLSADQMDRERTRRT